MELGRLDAKIAALKDRLHHGERQDGWRRGHSPLKAYPPPALKTGNGVPRAESNRKGFGVRSGDVRREPERASALRRLEFFQAVPPPSAFTLTLEATEPGLTGPQPGMSCRMESAFFSTGFSCVAQFNFYWQERFAPCQLFARTL